MSYLFVVLFPFFFLFILFSLPALLILPCFPSVVYQYLCVSFSTLCGHWGLMRARTTYDYIKAIATHNLAYTFVQLHLSSSIIWQYLNNTVYTSLIQGLKAAGVQFTQGIQEFPLIQEMSMELISLKGCQMIQRVAITNKTLYPHW